MAVVATVVTLIITLTTIILTVPYLKIFPKKYSYVFLNIKIPRTYPILTNCNLWSWSSNIYFREFFGWLFSSLKMEIQWFLGVGAFALVACEVPRLGVESELQLPVYTTATATRDPSCICSLYHSSQQHQILNPLSEARDRTHILMVPSQVR